MSCIRPLVRRLKRTHSRAGCRPESAVAALSCGHAAHPPFVSVAVTTYPRYERDEASLQNDGQSWEFFDAYGVRVDALEDGEQIPRVHVARPVWLVATHRGVLTARGLVITFVPTTGRKLEQ
jgi:hypothetical protein